MGESGEGRRCKGAEAALLSSTVGRRQVRRGQVRRRWVSPPESPRGDDDGGGGATSTMLLYGMYICGLNMINQEAMEVCRAHQWVVSYHCHFHNFVAASSHKEKIYLIKHFSCPTFQIFTRDTFSNI